MSGRTTAISMSLATNAIRSSARRTARSNSRFPSVQFAKQSRAFRLSLRSEAGPIFSSLVSRRFDTSRHSPIPASLGSEIERQRTGNSYEHPGSSAHVQPKSHSPQIHARQAPPEHLLDVELPVGVPAGPRGDGKSLLDDDRSPQRVVAGVSEAQVSARQMP